MGQPRDDASHDGSGPADASPDNQPHGDDDVAVEPELAEALRRIGLGGRASLSAAGDTAKAFRSLLTADVALARSALGRALAMSGLAVACGATSWLLLMGTLVVLLNVAGLPWPVALLLPTLLSLIATGLACWKAMRYFEHTRLQATRRQLARLDLAGLAGRIFPSDEGPDDEAQTPGGPDQ